MILESELSHIFKCMFQDGLYTIDFNPISNTLTLVLYWIYVFITSMFASLLSYYLVPPKYSIAMIILSVHVTMLFSSIYIYRLRNNSKKTEIVVRRFKINNVEVDILFLRFVSGKYERYYAAAADYYGRLVNTTGSVIWEGYIKQEVSKME